MVIHGEKLLIKPSKRSVKALLDKIQKIIKGNATATQDELIRRLNPVIRGWAMYHCHIVAKATFSSVGARIWRMLWKWARRRHSHKGAWWIRERYFKINRGRSWDFATEEDALFWAASISIKRHVKIRASANPFDPEWDAYFAHRRAAKLSNV